jgi:ammonium transporter Rh
MLNATLAGGVAMGANADIITAPWGAMLLGFIAGAVSALGYSYATPFVRGKIGLHDTCGVLYLHCIPGIMGGIVSAIVAALCDDSFGDNYYNEFSAVGRTAKQQAGFQLAGLGVTIGIAIISGILGGFIASR